MNPNQLKDLQPRIAILGYSVCLCCGVAAVGPRLFCSEQCLVIARGLIEYQKKEFDNLFSPTAASTNPT